MGESPKLGKIFIGGLSYETTDEKLRSYFGAYGTVTDAVVMKDPVSRRSRGFGFITYADPACVDRALAQPNHILDSRRVEAKRAVPRAESSRESSSSIRTSGSANASVHSPNSVGATRKIFVGGLHYETKDGYPQRKSMKADFRKYFENYGKVASAEVMFNRETNKSRGFGFVVFENENSVEAVLQNKGHVIDGKAVEVKRAVPRTDAPPSRSRGNSISSTGYPATSARSGSSGSPTGTEPNSPLSSDASFSTSLSTRVPPSASASSVTSASNQSSGNDTNPPTFTPVVTTSTVPLGGYAAAVRFGGRGPPPTTHIDSMSAKSSQYEEQADPQNQCSPGNDSPASQHRSPTMIPEIASPDSQVSGAQIGHKAPTPDDPVADALQWDQVHGSPGQWKLDSTPELPSHAGVHGDASLENWTLMRQQLSATQQWPSSERSTHRSRSEVRSPVLDSLAANPEMNGQGQVGGGSYFSMFSSADSSQNPTGSYRLPWDSTFGSVGRNGMGMSLGIGVGNSSLTAELGNGLGSESARYNGHLQARNDSAVPGMIALHGSNYEGLGPLAGSYGGREPSQRFQIANNDPGRPPYANHSSLMDHMGGVNGSRVPMNVPAVSSLGLARPGESLLEANSSIDSFQYPRYGTYPGGIRNSGATEQYHGDYR